MSHGSAFLCTQLGLILANLTHTQNVNSVLFQNSPVTWTPIHDPEASATAEREQLWPVPSRLWLPSRAYAQLYPTFLATPPPPCLSPPH